MRVLIVPLYVLGWLFKHPKVLAGAAILTVIIIGFNTCGKIISPKAANNASPPGAVSVPNYQLIAPDKTLAPYIIPTDTRIYYVAKFTDDKKVVTLTDYYTYDRKTWQHQTYPLPLDRRYIVIKDIIKR